ncbi:MAG: multidrug effflux MFS transporter [Burkholderiales bacterium]|nr:multidrug effflux MFS transporter [Burkholderiales bacterium]
MDTKIIKTEKKQGNSYFYVIYLLSFLAGFGPFITDFYLPALPQITEVLGCTASQTQLTLTMGMIGCGAGQFLIGPITDRYGRKYPLLVGLAVFMLASYGCYATRDIHWLMFFRLWQGLAGGVCMVLSRAIAVDLYRGRQLLKTYSIIGGITGLAPISAPLFGGILLYFTEWDDLFLGLLLLGAFLFIISLPFKESLSTERRITLRPSDLLGSYLTVLKNFPYTMYVGVQALSHGVLFAYISASPFIFQSHYELSAFQYSLLFGANALFLLLGSLCVMRLRDPRVALYRGCCFLLAFSVVLGFFLYFRISIWVLEPMFMALMFTLGLLFPSSTSLGMSLEPDHSGVAAAVFGACSFGIGSIVSPLPGLGDMFVLTPIIMVVFAFLTWLCGLQIIRLAKSEKPELHEVKLNH